MNILIVGNGFDLAHGLPTKYGDFLKYTDAFKRLKDICKQNSVVDKWVTANGEDKFFITHFNNLYAEKPKVFTEIDTLIADNIWIDYFWEIYKCRGTAGKDGWIDFENEISRIIQTLDKARLTILEEINQGAELGKMTQQQLNILSPLIKKPRISRDSIEFDENWIECRKAQLLADLNRLTRCLEIYLHDYVEEITPKAKLPDIDGMNLHCILSFNYTHTYERLYDDKSRKIKYDYIHGETRSDSNVDNCNLILGIDEYLEGYSKDRDNEFIQFKKFYQRIYKKTGCKYVDWVSSMERFPSNYGGDRDAIHHNVYIIGHSLDITDKDILSGLINTKNTKTTIFYHSQTALGNQISNLVKILGEDELIAKVHGTNASIVLQEQQEPIPMGH